MSFALVDFNEKNGLVFCKNNHLAENNAEFLYLSEALKLSVDAVFFRRFYRENSTKPYHSEPAVCIFHKDDTYFNSKEHIELHASLWSAGKNEVYIIQGTTRVDIINARKPAEVVDKTNLTLSNLVLASSSALQQFNDIRFSAHLFGNGTFWEQREFSEKSGDGIFFRNRLEEENMPYHQLLTFLKETRKYLKTDKHLKLTTEIIDKLLIICILIKYLEEIKNPDQTHTLSKIYKKYNVDNFADALSSKGTSISILEELGKKLNGRIFDYFTDKREDESDQEFLLRNAEIKDQLRDVDLSPIANLLLVRLNTQTGELEFDILTKQLKLDFDFSWQQYSFRFLPIELISSIYEHFLQEDAIEQKGEVEKGVVYTPPFLVNFLVDEMMPLDKPELLLNNKFKVLDPSCGSGIFLVSAYKRILQWWIINHYDQHGKIPEKLDPKVFQNLLEKNIFGVDINRKATLITVFSLTIAFLDKLDPIAFWENLNFDRLQNNIKSQSFFEWATDASKDFNLIIGNPPFNVPTEHKRKVKEYIRKNVIAYEKMASVEYSEDVPDANLALFFLEFAIPLCKENKICLIIPSNVILYSSKETTFKYRSDLLKRISLEKVYDFTHLRRILFKRLGKKEANEKNAEPSVCTLIFNNSAPTFKSIEHIVIKRLNVTDKKTRFEIDAYDRNLVKWDWAVDRNKKFIWKTNLLGGGRLFHIIYRLSLLQNLDDFINNKKEKNDEWIFQDGYKDLTHDPKVPFAEHLFNQNKISKIDSNGKITFDQIETGEKFLRPRPAKLFRLPLIAIHKKLGGDLLPIGIKENFHRDYLVFNSSFVGIHAPRNDYKSLAKIYQRFKEESQTYLLWILANSPSALVGHETSIKKNDLETLPFPDDADSDYLTLSATETVVRDDVLNFYKHLGKSITAGNDGYKLHQVVTSDQLVSYGNIFANELNLIYSNDEQSWQLGRVYQTTLFSICQIAFGKNNTLIHKISDEFDELIMPIIEDKLSNSGSIYSRVVRIYKHINGFDCIFNIKPHAQRYWLNSVALRDADDTFIDLKKAGF
ncbi:Eco57I restriction-modification methylase domain-containing protein [Chryseobacterium sp. SL1]|uniref:Eco57I restriction-modification methylase domain-containing protein n=1 Tax=Chryseobacterium sp. SL1 TaxID=2995159 RepID=UPI0022753AC4|nr:N-6 DNA methylase [Chryseobacterium sp. SL1]MCY1662585.1 N-6 DNA methylase [Chryseobacterium sp. SL1]